MKSTSGVVSQHNAVKINSNANNLAMNSKNFSNKIVASNKNQYRPIQMKKKQFINISSKNLHQLRSRLSKSIQQLPQTQASGSVISLFDSPKSILTKKFTKNNMNQILIQNCQEQTQDELFSSSYQKLNNVYHNFQQYKNKSTIEEELSQVLVLIKEQRSIIRNKLQEIQIKRMKKSNVMTVETAQNTQPLIVQNQQKQAKEIEVQTQNYPSNQYEQQIINNQTYNKLIKILQDMNINSKQILPQDIKIEHQKQENKDKKYQQLKESQVIRVQKFVIKKLVQRISALQNNNHQESLA